MKKRVSALLAVLLALCLLCACGKKQDPAPVTPVEPDVPQSAAPVIVPDVPQSAAPAADPTPAQPQEEELTPVEYTSVSLARTFTDTDGAELLTYALDYPVFEGLDEINAYYQARAERLAAQYETEAEEAAQWRADVLSTGGDFEPYQRDLMFYVDRNDGKLLSVQESLYDMSGGPHPNTVYSATTFFVESQGRMLLGDLFNVPESEYLPLLLTQVRAQMDANEAEYGEMYYENAREDLEQIFDRENFLLTDTDLVLCFNTYELAPHAAGPQYFEISLSSLSDILQSWMKA